ncbi:MAG: hypothetical protein KDA84_23170, partial [Planctomycetaceae bacterium]|nr:hypothetical protein [Planctomycetaceae bacterium]
EETAGIQTVGDIQLAGSNSSGVETAGFCEVSDGCAPKGGSVYTSRGPYGYTDDCWQECEEDLCQCQDCCMKRYIAHCRNCFWKYLREDGPYGDYDPNSIARGAGSRGGWRREIPARGQYYMAYPVNPYHFDQRDGRIYGAQGYGHAVAVPLAPNVEHTFNYGWGVPSSRLTPVSRMPGAPGVAIPAVPGAAGPGVLPPAFPNPLSAGLGR